jgi:hypothetical protein
MGQNKDQNKSQPVSSHDTLGHPAERTSASFDRREFLQTSSLAAIAAAATLSWPQRSSADAGDLKTITDEIANAMRKASSACRPGFVSPPSPPKTVV